MLVRSESSTSDAAADFEADPASQLDLGRDARRDDHELRLDHFAAGELDAVVVDRGGGAVAEHVDALPTQCAFEHPPGGVIELAFHQAVGEVDDGDRDPAVRDRTRGLQPEQPAADHDRSSRPVRAAADGADVVAGAERRRALDPLDRWKERARARRQHERVVGLLRAVGEGGDAPLGVDIDDRAAEGDLAVQVPGLRVQREVGGGFVAGEMVAERDAVVRLTAFVAGDRDARVAVLEDRLRGGDAGVSAADDQHVLGAPAAACRDRLDADRGRLQAGLTRHRVGLAVGEVVEAAVPRGRVQLAPVERARTRCRDAGCRRSGPSASPRRGGRSRARAGRP